MDFYLTRHARQHWAGRCAQATGAATASVVAAAARPADADEGSAARAYFGSKPSDVFFLVADDQDIIFACVYCDAYTTIISCSTIALIAQRLQELQARDAVAARRARKRARKRLDRQPERGRGNRRAYAATPEES